MVSRYEDGADERDGQAGCASSHGKFLVFESGGHAISQQVRVGREGQIDNGPEPLLPVDNATSKRHACCRCPSGSRLIK